MPEVVRRYWRPAAIFSAVAMAGFAFGFFVFDASGQQPAGQNYVTEKELVEWWYAQVGKLIWRWWVPLVGFLIVWTWRGFTWQAKTAQAIADNAEAVKANAKSIQQLAEKSARSVERAATEAAVADARLQAMVRTVGEAVIATLGDEAEKRRLNRSLLELD